jgi:hypothetical protein
VPTRSALCSSSRLFAVAQLHGAIRDRKTKYFKITSRSIALHFGIAIALVGFYPYCSESAIFEKGDRAIFDSYAFRSSSWR